MIFDIREKNPADPRLARAADEIIKVLGKVGQFKEGGYLVSLHRTGAKIADDYFAARPGLLAIHCWEDDRKPYRHKHEFETWDEILSRRDYLNSPSYNSPDEDDYYRDYWRSQAEDDDYAYSRHYYREGLLSESDREFITKAETMVREMDLSPTVAPIAKLCLFNQLRANADESKINETVNKIKKMGEEEEKCENSNFLPTIGIEIECHESELDPDKVAVLETLNIPNYKEARDDLWEVNPSFSYSSSVQSRYMQELVKMGAVMLGRQDDGKAFIPEHHLLSLHVNLGIPESAESIRGYKKKVYLLSDALNYAFTSGRRIQERKTNTSVSFREAVESKKSKDKAELLGESRKKLKKKKVKNKDSHEFVRLELRASEFRDYKTFLMLESAQRIGAALFSYVKAAGGRKPEEKELELARWWKSFEKDYLEIMRKKEIRTVNLVDENPYYAASLADEIEFKKKCRELVYKYARKIGKSLDI